MKAIAQAEIASEDWDALVEESPQAWLFHYTDWIELESRFFGAENLSFAVTDGGQPIALMPLYHSRLGLGQFVEELIHNGLHRHTGLALRSGLSTEEVRAVRKTAMNQVLDTAVMRDADRVYLAHQDLTPESRSPARAEIPHWVQENRFQLGNSFGLAGLAPAPGLATTIVDQMVDLALPKTEVFSHFKESCRRAIRKAENAGCEAVELTDSDDSVKDYYRIAKLSVERTGEALPDIGFYGSLQPRLAPRGLCTFLFVRIGIDDAAAAILLHDKQALHFFSGASDPAFLDRRVSDYLHWAAIQLGMKRDYSHYRLGPYFPALPKGWPVETVSRFKAKFGADPWTIVQGSLFLKPRRYIELAQAHITQLCEALGE